MDLTAHDDSTKNPDRQAGARIRDDAIMELARRLYEHMEIEDPHEDKPWVSLQASERDFYVGAIRHVLSWKDTVLTALRFPSAAQQRSNKPAPQRGQINESG